MSSPLILFVGGLYALIAIEQFCKGSHAMGVVWLGYAVANIGLAAASR